MDRSIKLWQLFGFGVVSLGGTLLHFVYEWTNESPWVAPFSAINESTWEHMKLFFWPALCYAIIESFFFRKKEDFFCTKLRGIVSGLFLIPILFYTYNGVIGKSPDFVNIAIFFVATAAAFLLETKIFTKKRPTCRNKALAVLALSLIGIAFVVFTFYPPALAIFQDPTAAPYQ